MNCRFCGEYAKRSNSHRLQAGTVTRRSRRCLKCGRTFRTIEVEETVAVIDRLEECGAIHVGMIFVRST